MSIPVWRNEMIRFRCPNCSSILSVPDHAIGKKGTCPKCAQRLQVPPPIRRPTVIGAAPPGVSLVPMPQVATSNETQSDPELSIGSERPRHMQPATKMLLGALGTAVMVIGLLLFLSGWDRTGVDELFELSLPRDTIDVLYPEKQQGRFVAMALGTTFVLAGLVLLLLSRRVLPQSKQEFAFVRVSGNTLAEEYP